MTTQCPQCKQTVAIIDGNIGKHIRQHPHAPPYIEQCPASGTPAQGDDEEWDDVTVLLAGGGSCKLVDHPAFRRAVLEIISDVALQANMKHDHDEAVLLEIADMAKCLKDQTK